MENNIKLPELTHEQVSQLTKFIGAIDMYEEVNEDGFCCTSDAISEVVGIVINCLKKKYGMGYYLRSEDKDINGEDDDEE